jgi:hypothetical protein
MMFKTINDLLFSYSRAFLLVLLTTIAVNAQDQASLTSLYSQIENTELNSANLNPQDFQKRWNASTFFEDLETEYNVDNIFVTSLGIRDNDDEEVWALANGEIDSDGRDRKVFLTRHDGSWEVIHTFDLANFISSFNLPMHVNTNGDIWFTDGSALFKLENDNDITTYSLQDYGLDPFVGTEAIADLIEDPAGVLWMFTSRNRLLEFTGETLQAYDNENSPMPSDYTISSIYSEKYLAITDSGLWIKTGKIEGGLIRKNGDTWDVFTEENSSLPSNFVTGVIAQDSDHLWVSTRPTEFDSTAVVGEDDDIWVNGGLLEIKGDIWTVHTNETGLPSNFVRVLAVESDQYLWAQFGNDATSFDVTMLGPITEYDGQSWNQATDYNDITAYSMVVTDDEIKWLTGELSGFPDGVITFNEVYVDFISTPLANRGYLSGDEFELTWDAGRRVENVNLSYTSDQSAELIESNIDANDSSYTYTFPDELLTGVQIRIRDKDRSVVYDTTGVFSIFDPSQVQYHLRKEFPNNTVELFDPAVHGWNFSNSSGNMWPDSAWTDRDPYEGMLAGFPFNGVRSDFPSWEMFESAFGEEETYSEFLGYPHPRLLAATVWAALKSQGWQGSCHGFAVSSLIAFTEGASQLPAYGVQTDEEFLYDIPLADDNRFLINKYWTQQWSIDHLPGIILNALADDIIEQLLSGNISFDSLADNEDLFTGPSETLELVKEMLQRKDPGDYHKNLTLINPDNVSGAHSILPYKAEQSTTDPDIWYIYVYDSNYPGEVNRRIAINTESDEWVYENVFIKDTTTPKYQGSIGLFLGDPSDNYKTTSRLLKENGQENTLRSQITSLSDVGYFYTLKSPNTNLRLTDKNGRITSLEDGVIASNIPGSFPITPLVGDLADPVGYFLLEENYDITLDYKENQMEGNFMFISDKSLYSFSNLEADQQNPDRLKFGEELTIYTANKTPDYRFDVSVIDENTNQNKMYNLKNTAISTEDSISVFMEEAGDLVIDNFGGVANLTLEIKEALTEDFFFVENFSLSESSSYKLSPDWDNLTEQNLIVQVDSNMDGNYDETFEVSPETPVSIETNESSNIPAKFELKQNYPNPFNPTTNIDFNLPSSAYVELSVYNTLGQKVATLVNDQMKAGSHSINWDARNMSSGVYLYKIQVGNKIQTRKMILMK